MILKQNRENLLKLKIITQIPLPLFCHASKRSKSIQEIKIHEGKRDTNKKYMYQLKIHETI